MDQILQPKTRILLIVISILVVYIFLKYYFGVSQSFLIIQMPIDKLSTSHLLERQPIVVDSLLVNPISFVNQIFRYLYTKKRIKVVQTQHDFVSSNARFTVLYSSNNDTSCQVMHPIYKERIVQIIIPKRKCLVIPYKWNYRIVGKDVLNVELFDITSLIYNTFKRK